MLMLRETVLIAEKEMSDNLVFALLLLLLLNKYVFGLG